jgi:phenylacetate-CoA ligase
MFYEALFKAGAKWRNPQLFEVAKQLQATDFASQDVYRAIQAEKLDQLFQFHKRHSAYYRDLLPATWQNPHAVLASLPILTKSDLLQHHDAMQCYAFCGKSFSAETSGTSGQPFSFRKDLVWDTAHRATIIRSYWWHNIEPWQRNGYFWGYNFSAKEKAKTKLLDDLQNRFRVFSYREDELIQFLKKMHSAAFIHGYSSLIYEVAQIAQKLGFGPSDFPKLKMVKGTSEKIYDYYQGPVIQVFGKPMISEYGSAEGGIHAFECPSGQMHINEENVILEEVDGQVVVTNLNAFSLPILRYALGDAITIDRTTACACGRKSGIVKEVLGRVGKKIVGNRTNYPSLTLYYVFKNIALKNGVDIQYQGYQSEKGKLDLRIPRQLSEVEKNWIAEQCRTYFSDDVAINLVEGFEIHTHKGKLKDFITDLTPVIKK